MDLVPVGLLLSVLAAALVVVLWARRRRSGGRLERPAEAAPAPAAWREGLGENVRALFRGNSCWEELEGLLLRADVGPAGSRELVRRLRADREAARDPAQALERHVADLFAGDEGLRIGPERPAVLMVVGVNGSGKTTTAGKLAARFADAGEDVTVAACDTFRAAAGEQIETWAARAGAHLVSSSRGGDPAAAAFDAVQSARARGSDVVIVDTAGRLHTKTPLMEELGKIRRVLEKAAGRPPDEVLLALDATTGQNGIAQAKAFAEAVGVTGIVLTKFDGSAKGGIVIAVREAFGLPVKLVGTGEGPEDLVEFDPETFARELVGA